MSHLDRRRLPFLGGLADRVDEAHVRVRKPPPDQRHHVPDLLDRLRRLRRDADPRMLLEREDVIVVEHDVEAVQIAGEASDFDVVALADDDDVVAVAGERRDGAVRDVTSGQVASTTVSPRARVRASVRSDVPCAVTITVCVLTCATSCATATPSLRERPERWDCGRGRRGS